MHIILKDCSSVQNTVQHDYEQLVLKHPQISNQARFKAYKLREQLFLTAAKLHIVITHSAQTKRMFTPYVIKD